MIRIVSKPAAFASSIFAIATGRVGVPAFVLGRTHEHRGSGRPSEAEEDAQRAGNEEEGAEASQVAQR